MLFNWSFASPPFHTVFCQEWMINTSVLNWIELPENGSI